MLNACGSLSSHVLRARLFEERRVRPQYLTLHVNPRTHLISLITPDRIRVAMSALIPYLISRECIMSGLDIAQDLWTSPLTMCS